MEPFPHPLANDELDVQIAIETPLRERFAGTLVLAGTPIGDVGDASPKLVALLECADIVAAEDTRRLVALLGRLGIRASGRIVSYYEHNESGRAGELVDAVVAGGIVLVVTDAGMPTVSDPGYRVVREALDRGVRVTAVPGPSAPLAALAVSGLPTDRFSFEGFPPRKSGMRQRMLEELKNERRTMVFFESPHRLGDFLAQARDVLGADRQGAICRELTKVYEEVVRGPLSELAEWALGEVRGEVTVVIGGADPEPISIDSLVPVALDLVADGGRLKEVTTALAAEHDVSRRELYEAVLAARAQSKS